MTAADRSSGTDNARAEVRRVLENEFWPFLAHDPHDPDRFWGQAVDAVMGLLATARTRPTQTEWAHRLDSGGASVHRTREDAESARERHLQRVPYPVDEPPPPASLGIWRREVTAWTEADQ